VWGIESQPLLHVDRVTETNRGLVMLVSLDVDEKLAINEASQGSFQQPVWRLKGIHVTPTRKEHFKREREEED